jgi:hypothetical protein
VEVGSVGSEACTGVSGSKREWNYWRIGCEIL